MLCEVYGGRGTQFVSIMTDKSAKYFSQRRTLAALMFEYIYQETNYFDNNPELAIKYASLYTSTDKDLVYELSTEVFNLYIVQRQKIVKSQKN